MTTNTHKGRSTHRLGRRAGLAWRGYLRREQRVAGWLVTRGVPAGAATAVLWIVKLAVLGMDKAPGMRLADQNDSATAHAGSSAASPSAVSVTGSDDAGAGPWCAAGTSDGRVTSGSRSSVSVGLDSAL